MKSCLILLLLQTFASTIDAQEIICKKVNDIALQESKAGAKYFENKLSSLASANFSVSYSRCEWQVDPAQLYIKGAVTHYFKMITAGSNIVFDLYNGLKVDSILMRTSKLVFSQHLNQTLNIQLPGLYNSGTADSISIFYKGIPAGSGFGSFVKSSHNGQPVIWTLSEPYGARDWWPCRNGLDDKTDSIDVYITHPSKYRASSNGIPVREKTRGNTTIIHYKHSYPIATYLVAMAVTNYSVFTDNVKIGNKTLPVIQYIYPEDSAAFRNAIPTTLNALKFFSESFAPYPFLKERYGQTQFSWGGGMEHQTNSFITNYSENLMTHELAHQWFGDKITCGSWEDIWLNEGFATFCADFLYTEIFNPAQYKINVKANLDYIVSGAGGSVKVDDTTSVGRIFDGRLSYDKGAFLLRMLRWTLGDIVFFKGIKNYLNDPLLRYGFARTADLKRNMEAASRTDLTYFFDQWFSGQGYPAFTVKWSQGARNVAGITVSQSASHPSVSFFRVPLALKFKNATMEKTVIVQHTFNNQFFSEDIGFAADTVLIDPDYFLISKNNKSVHTTLGKKEDQLIAAVTPNPFTEQIRVSVSQTGNTRVQVQLYNNAGQNVYSSYFNADDGGNYSLKLPSGIPPGIYALHVFANGKTAVKTLVKK